MNDIKDQKNKFINLIKDTKIFNKENDKKLEFFSNNFLNKDIFQSLMNKDEIEFKINFFSSIIHIISQNELFIYYILSIFNLEIEKKYSFYTYLIQIYMNNNDTNLDNLIYEILKKLTKNLLTIEKNDIINFYNLISKYYILDNIDEIIINKIFNLFVIFYNINDVNINEKYFLVLFNDFLYMEIDELEQKQLPLYCSFFFKFDLEYLKQFISFKECKIINLKFSDMSFISIEVDNKFNLNLNINKNIQLIEKIEDGVNYILISILKKDILIYNFNNNDLKNNKILNLKKFTHHLIFKNNQISKIVFFENFLGKIYNISGCFGEISQEILNKIQSYISNNYQNENYEINALNIIKNKYSSNKLFLFKSEQNQEKINDNINYINDYFNNFLLIYDNFNVFLYNFEQYSKDIKLINGFKEFYPFLEIYLIYLNNEIDIENNKESFDLKLNNFLIFFKKIFINLLINNLNNLLCFDNEKFIIILEDFLIKLNKKYFNEKFLDLYNELFNYFLTSEKNIKLKYYFDAFLNPLILNKFPYDLQLLKIWKNIEIENFYIYFNFENILDILNFCDIENFKKYFCCKNHYEQLLNSDKKINNNYMNQFNCFINYLNAFILDEENNNNNNLVIYKIIEKLKNDNISPCFRNLLILLLNKIKKNNEILQIFNDNIEILLNKCLGSNYIDIKYFSFSFILDILNKFYKKPDNKIIYLFHKNIFFDLNNNQIIKINEENLKIYLTKIINILEKFYKNDTDKNIFIYINLLICIYSKINYFKNNYLIKTIYFKFLLYENKNQGNLYLLDFLKYIKNFIDSITNNNLFFNLNNYEFKPKELLKMKEMFKSFSQEFFESLLILYIFHSNLSNFFPINNDIKEFKEIENSIKLILKNIIIYLFKLFENKPENINIFIQYLFTNYQYLDTFPFEILEEIWKDKIKYLIDTNEIDELSDWLYYNYKLIIKIYQNVHLKLFQEKFKIIILNLFEFIKSILLNDKYNEGIKIISKEFLKNIFRKSCLLNIEFFKEITDQDFLNKYLYPKNNIEQNTIQNEIKNIFNIERYLKLKINEKYLYKLKKNLFSFNEFWSNKELFYNITAIKNIKTLNYYSREYFKNINLNVFSNLNDVLYKYKSYDYFTNKYFIYDEYEKNKYSCKIISDDKNYNGYLYLSEEIQKIYFYQNLNECKYSFFKNFIINYFDILFILPRKIDLNNEIITLFLFCGKTITIKFENNKYNNIFINLLLYSKMFGNIINDLEKINNNNNNNILAYYNIKSIKFTKLNSFHINENDYYIIKLKSILTQWQKNKLSNNYFNNFLNLITGEKTPCINLNNMEDNNLFEFFNMSYGSQSRNIKLFTKNDFPKKFPNKNERFFDLQFKSFEINLYKIKIKENQILFSKILYDKNKSDFQPEFLFIYEKNLLSIQLPNSNIQIYQKKMDQFKFILDLNLNITNKYNNNLNNLLYKYFFYTKLNMLFIFIKNSRKIIIISKEDDYNINSNNKIKSYKIKEKELNYGIFKDFFTSITVINYIKKQFLMLGTLKGNIEIYTINNNFEFKEYKFISTNSLEILNIYYNYYLNLFITSSKDLYINIYYFPECKLLQSIKAKYYIDFVFLSGIGTPYIIGISIEYNEINVYEIDGNLLFTKKEELILIPKLFENSDLGLCFLSYINSKDSIKILEIPLIQNEKIIKFYTEINNYDILLEKNLIVGCNKKGKIIEILKDK